MFNDVKIVNSKKVDIKIFWTTINTKYENFGVRTINTKI